MMTITIMMTTKPMTGTIKACKRVITFTTIKRFTIVMTMITTSMTTTSILMMIVSFLFLALPTQMPFPYAFDDNKFLVLWRFDDQADKIHVHLRVKTTGWIGFGFAQKAPNDMRDYDVIVGGFSNGRGYLWVSSSFSFSSRAFLRRQRCAEDKERLAMTSAVMARMVCIDTNSSWIKFFTVLQVHKATGLSPCCRFFTHNQIRPS